MPGDRNLFTTLADQGMLHFGKISGGCAVRTNPLARGTLRVSKGAIES
jgi:hypothetical protein